MFEVILRIFLIFFIAHIHRYSRWCKPLQRKSFSTDVGVGTFLVLQNGKSKVFSLYYVCTLKASSTLYVPIYQEDFILQRHLMRARNRHVQGGRAVKQRSWIIPAACFNADCWFSGQYFKRIRREKTWGTFYDVTTSRPSKSRGFAGAWRRLEFLFPFRDRKTHLRPQRQRLAGREQRKSKDPGAYRGEPATARDFLSSS